MKQLWKRQSFARQLAIVFMSVLLFQLLVVEGIGSRYLKSFMEERIEESYQTALKQTALSADSSLQIYKDGIDELLRNSKFILTMEALKNMEAENEWQVKTDLEDVMKDFMAYRSEVRSFSVKTVNGITYSYDRQKVELLNPVISQLHQSYFDRYLFEDTQGIKGKWVATEFFDINGTTTNYVFTYGKQIKDLYTSRLVGTAIISIEEEALSNICSNAQINQDRSINYVIMTDEKGLIISHYDKDKIGQNANKYITAQEEAGYLVLEEEINLTGWKVVSLLSEDYIYLRLKEVQRFTMLISLMMVAMVLIIIFFVSKKMTRYITNIVDTMNKVQHGKMNAKVGIAQDEKNEINQIATHFNVMMNTVNEQMNIIKESGEKQKEAEIRALEAQINPHFIYNTLDSINWLAIENDEQEISNMLSKFGQILRYQIQKSNKIVLIEEELTYLEQYLFLQKVRFMNSFEYVIECQEAVKKCHIYKMIFQPFIENAVLHGIADIEYGGLIKVSIRNYNQDHFIFIIEDNGKGMTRKRIEEIFAKDANPENSIGISNVLARLDLYYGKNYSIMVKECERGGTTIETVIPKWCTQKEEREGDEDYSS